MRRVGWVALQHSELRKRGLKDLAFRAPVVLAGAIGLLGAVIAHRGAAADLTSASHVLGTIEAREDTEKIETIAAQRHAQTSTREEAVVSLESDLGEEIAFEKGSQANVKAGGDNSSSEPEILHDSLPGSSSEKTGASSQAIQVPKGSGTIEGMGESFSMQLSTGIGTFSVPIAIPRARGGAQPSLSLAYSSSSGWGIAGVGWDMGVPFIARQTDRGIPGYDDRTDF